MTTAVAHQTTTTPTERLDTPHIHRPHIITNLNPAALEEEILPSHHVHHPTTATTGFRVAHKPTIHGIPTPNSSNLVEVTPPSNALTLPPNLTPHRSPHSTLAPGGVRQSSFLQDISCLTPQINLVRSPPSTVAHQPMFLPGDQLDSVNGRTQSEARGTSPANSIGLNSSISQLNSSSTYKVRILHHQNHRNSSSRLGDSASPTHSLLGGSHMYKGRDARDDTVPPFVDQGRDIAAAIERLARANDQQTSAICARLDTFEAFMRGFPTTSNVSLDGRFLLNVGGEGPFIAPTRSGSTKSLRSLSPATSTSEIVPFQQQQVSRTAAAAAVLTPRCLHAKRSKNSLNNLLRRLLILLCKTLVLWLTRLQSSAEKAAVFDPVK